jgi:hypothetical protein
VLAPRSFVRFARLIELSQLHLWIIHHDELLMEASHRSHLLSIIAQQHHTQNKPIRDSSLIKYNRENENES